MDVRIRNWRAKLRGLSGACTQVAMLLFVAACHEAAGPDQDVPPVATKVDLGILWWTISGTSDGGFVARTGGAVNRYTRDGSLVWSRQIQFGDFGQCPTDPPCITAIDDQDNVYVPQYTGLVSLNASGTQRWRVPQATGGTVTVGSDDRVYAATIPSGFSPRVLYALKKTSGEILWQSPSFGVALLLLDETRKSLYGIGGSLVLAFNPSTGEEQWRLSLPCDGRFAALGSNGIIYVTCSESLSAVDPSGVIIWTASLGSSGNGGGLSPVIDADGTVLVANALTLTAVNANGSIKWHYTSGPLALFGPTSPAIDAAHNIYIVQSLPNGPALVQINNGALRHVIYSIQDPHGRAILVAKDGRVFFNANGSIVFFDTKGLNEAVWSQMGGGPGRTGRR